MTARNTSITETAVLTTLGGVPSHSWPAGETTLGARPSSDIAGGPDLLLVRRVAAHDAEALRLLVDRHQAKLLGFLGRILDSPEDAEEAAQDVFLRVWQQAGRFQERSGFATWMYRIAANVACDMLRRRRVRARVTQSLGDEPGDDKADPQAQALARLDREERARQLDQALRALRAEDRLLLVLYYAEDLGYDEIRAVTGDSYPVLKVRLLRARRRLRDLLEPSLAEGVE